MTNTPKAAFHRSMHGFGALMITLSALSPAIGVFAVGSDVIHTAGTAVFPAFLIAVLVGVAMANVYGELGSAYADTGGEYTLVGRTLGPTAGFAILGNNIVGFSIANALVGLSMAKYLAVLAPGLPSIPTALALVAIVTGMGILNIRLNAWITGVFLVAELAALVAVAALGFLHPHCDIAQAAFSMMGPAPHGGLMHAGLSVVGMASVAALYAFNGYGSVVFLGEELHEAPKRIARVAFIALGLAAVTELVPLLAVLVGAPDLKALVASDSSIPFFAQTVGGPVWSKVVGLCVALANFNCMIVVALMGGRQLYATGRDRVWPALISDALSKVHSRFNSPWVATIVAGAASAALCFVKFEILVVVVASGVAAQYASLCIAVIRGRLRGDTGREGMYRMPLFPLFPAAGLIALIGVIWASWLDEDTGRPGLIAIAVTFAASAAYYWLFLRKSGWAHRGPTAVDPVD